MSKRTDAILVLAPPAQRIQREYGWLASVTIAQGVLESGDLASTLSKKYFNLFGIKGKGVVLKTNEVVNGQTITIDAEFRTYSSYDESFKDRAEMLLNAKLGDRVTYRYRHLCGSKDYAFVCRGLQKAGYATDPKYADKLISIIETYQLYKYDELPAEISPWAETAWAWAIKEKLVDGTDPKGAVTREMLMTFLHRFESRGT